MTEYANYQFYTDEYLTGKTPAVTAADFPYYARQASAIIDRFTHNNIKGNDYPEEVSYCCCELAEMMYKTDSSEAAQKGGISSESVQGWSQSYESAEARQSAFSSSQRSCIYKWLGATGLLYSGVRSC